MALAPSALTFTGNFAKSNGVNPSGGTKYLYQMGLKWTENETSACFYRVEVNIPAPNGSGWTFVKDVTKGVGAAFFYAARGSVFENKVNVATQVRVTCITIPDDLSPGIATATVTVPGNSHVAASNFLAHGLGKVADQFGSVDVTWDDSSAFVQGGRVWIYLPKYGVRIAGSDMYIGGPGATFGDGFGHGVDGHGHARIAGIPLIQTQQPVNVDGVAFPAGGAPFVQDGDLVSVWLDTNTVDLSKNTPLVGTTAYSLRTPFSFIFYHEITITQFAASATRTVPFSKQVEKTGPTATFSATGLPAGLSISSGGLITGTPTTEGVYSPVIQATNPSGVVSTQACTIVVNPPAIPVINSPATTQVLKTLLPVSLFLRATNNPASFAIVSGTLPTGLSLNTTTGEISGTPTVVQSPANVVFKATNAVGDSSNYTVSFQVVALTTPVVNSGSTLTAYPAEPVAYTITADVPFTDLNISGLPTGLRRQGSQIIGTISSSVIQGTYPVSIKAINQAGIGPEFILTVTVSVRPPVISSALTATGFVGSNFRYQIGATHSPTSYSATALPDGLAIDEKGLISGTPTTVGEYSVDITATNAGGSNTKTLAITIIVPPKPVIDQGITSGKTVTAKANVPFVFAPSASNSPTSWSGNPIPDGMAIDATSGKLSGAFNVPGLYAVTFVATNGGGDSDPVTFYFLVAEGPPTAVQANSSGIDIWIDLHSGKVAVSDPTSANSTVVVKRGDTSEFNIRFHKDGIPIDILPSALKAAAKIDLEEAEYVVYIDTFEKIGTGAFRMLPDFSDNNTELESDLNQNSLDLIAEVQWETADPAVRRSSNTFTLTVLRDVIHPD